MNGVFAGPWPRRNYQAEVAHDYHNYYRICQKKNFADIVNKVAYGKEPVVLTRRGQEIAALVSMDEFELIKQIEDHMGIEDAKKALSEPGDNVSAQEVWKQLGL